MPKNIIFKPHPFNLQSVPVIFMTAKVMQSEIEEYKQMGAIEVVAKPFDAMTLAEQLKLAWVNK